MIFIEYEFYKKILKNKKINKKYHSSEIRPGFIKITLILDNNIIALDVSHYFLLSCINTTFL